MLSRLKKSFNNLCNRCLLSSQSQKTTSYHFCPKKPADRVTPGAFVTLAFPFMCNVKDMAKTEQC